MDISGELGELAQTDLCLPYSLICDTWDKVEERDIYHITRDSFEKYLEQAILAYKADPLNYVFNVRALPN